MRKALRIAIEVATPPLFGALLLGIPATCFDARNALSLIGTVTTVAYVLATIPSIAYALCMEVAFAAGLDPKRNKAIALSALLGFLAGLAMLPFVSGGDLIRIKGGARAAIPVVGLIVGILVAALVRMLEKKHDERKDLPPTARTDGPGPLP